MVDSLVSNGGRRSLPKPGDRRRKLDEIGEHAQYE